MTCIMQQTVLYLIGWLTLYGLTERK